MLQGHQSIDIHTEHILHTVDRVQNNQTKTEEGEKPLMGLTYQLGPIVQHLMLIIIIAKSKYDNDKRSVCVFVKRAIDRFSLLNLNAWPR